MLSLKQLRKQMSSESSAGFNRQQQGILRKSAGATSSSGGGGSGGRELIPMGNFSYRNGGGSVNLSGNDCPRGVLFSSQNSVDSCLTQVLDSAPGLKHDTGFAVEWSIDEQYKLEEGLAKYAYEPNIARYIKIAASLHHKTVRDVALRCKWMIKKRRKQEHQSLRKTVKDQKEKLAESALVTSAPSVNVAPYSSATNHHNQSDCKLLGVPGGTARHLLEENTQAFEQIFVNLSTLKLQQNIDLFFRTRNNLIAILNGMRNMPGIMSQMPPLPVLLNEELASTIFPLSSQNMMFSSSTTTPVKQEPGC